jgi:hypothetical protein
MPLLLSIGQLEEALLMQKMTTGGSAESDETDVTVGPDRRRRRLL